jgi:hypothetical protein
MIPIIRNPFLLDTFDRNCKQLPAFCGLWKADKAAHTPRCEVQSLRAHLQLETNDDCYTALNVFHI